MKSEGYLKWLDEAALRELGTLEFLARGRVDGFVAGRHRSSRKGSSAEFAEHREYQPGDDLRRLDWKLAARRQRVYVREYIDETNLRATVVLDHSGSMGYAGGRSFRGLAKLDYAKYLAASLTYLLSGQQDAVGFAAFADSIDSFIPARSRKTQVKAVLESLDVLKPSADTSMSAALDEIAERIPRRSVVFILSDFYDDVNALIRALHHLRFRNHEVVAIEIAAEEELSFPFERMAIFRDLESASELEVDVKALKNDYLDRFNRHLAELKRACGEMKIVHELVNTSVPFKDALCDILVRYHRRGGGR